MQRVVRDTGRDQHDRVCGDDVLAAESVESAFAPADRDELRSHRRLDVEIGEPLPNDASLVGVVQEGTDDLERRHVADGSPGRGEQLRHPHPHEVALAVVHEHRLPGRLLAGEHALRRQHVGAVRAWDRSVRQVVQPVGGPVGPGREDNDLRALLADRVCVEGDARGQLDVLELCELGLPPVDDVRP